MEVGRRARASSSATSQNASEESASWRSNRAMSAVSPLGPGAAPRRERLRLVSKAGAGSATGASKGEPGQQVAVEWVCAKPRPSVDRTTKATRG